ncbi:MAG: invasion associated locus B family protein [Pseudomonadota bacterium]
MKQFILLAAFAVGVWPVMAGAQTSTNRVAAETDWSIFTDDNPKECWAVSAPKETVNTRGGQVVDVRRSEILLIVFERPEEGLKGQVAFTGGYPFAPGRPIELDVDGTKFNLSTKEEWAWPATPEDDAKVIAAMKRGAKATITGRSSRGTVTKDEFSLLGFTAAVTKAAELCRG